LQNVFFLILGKVFVACPKKVLSKKPFANKIFTEYYLLGVTIGKDFIDCKKTFAECLGYSAKNISLVVFILCERRSYLVGR
jgi:hypothetical protein